MGEARSAGNINMELIKEFDRRPGIKIRSSYDNENILLEEIMQTYNEWTHGIDWITISKIKLKKEELLEILRKV